MILVWEVLFRHVDGCNETQKAELYSCPPRREEVEVEREGEGFGRQPAVTGVIL